MSNGPITPERAEAPRRVGDAASSAEQDQTPLRTGAADSLGGTAACTGSAPAEGVRAATHAEAHMGGSQASPGIADSADRASSYSAFYRDEPEQSGSEGAWPVRGDTEDALTVGEGSLSLWWRETVQPRAPARASTSLQQLPPDVAGGPPSPRPQQAEVVPPQQRSAHAPEASRKQPMTPDAEGRGSNGHRWAHTEKPRGTKSEGEEHFVAAPSAHTYGELMLSQHGPWCSRRLGSHMICDAPSNRGP